MLVGMVVGCAAPGTNALSAHPPESPAAARSAQGPKRVVAAVMSEPYTLANKLNIAGLTAGIDALEEIVSAGLVATDNQGAPFAQLAEAVPTVENELWKLLPDGRMDLTWSIRPNARWHDATPVTTDDLLFTLTLGNDRELAVFRDPTLDLIEGAEQIDERSVTVRWKQPYIYADTLFTRLLALPVPRHILAKPYGEDKTGFTDLPYWTQEFVGTGPYQVREFERGSHMLLAAFDRYVLGRPKIDEIEVRFIPAHATLMSNLLAGTVEVTIGRNLSLDQAFQIRDQWRDGHAEIGLGNWIVVYPQHLNPTPAVIGNVEFRRAMLHAIDRQQLVDSIQYGQTSIAHSFVSPDEPEYRDIQGDVVRYDYDERRAAQLIEGLGYTRGPEGFRDSAGRPLSVEFRTVDNNQIHMPTLLTVADYWQRLGVTVEQVAIPQQRANEREYRTTFPGFELLQNPNDLRGVNRYQSNRAALPENNFQVFGNNSRYMKAELDALIDRYYVTIPKPERTRVVGQIVRHTTDQVTMLGMFYVAVPSMVNNRVKNVTARSGSSPGAWNAHEWDVV